MPQIQFEALISNFQLSDKSYIKVWVYNVIDLYNKDCGVLKFLFCDDYYLFKLNKEFLNHETLTDILTFNYNDDNIVNGEIYISIERVKENAFKFKTAFTQELHRVMIHGVLHLLGLNDKTKKEKEIMRMTEDKMLELLMI